MTNSKLERAIVVGMGSIGERHRRLLSEAGLTITTVSSRPGVGDFTSVADAVSACPDALLVIASDTAEHMDHVRIAKAAGHCAPTLVEKPLGATQDDLWLPVNTSNIWVGYNLRYSPIITKLRTALGLSKAPVISVRMHVGQHLATWRVGTDVKASYSAHKRRGGGVLRDLSHELDLSAWLWGSTVGFCALGGRRANITEDSDDCWSILMRTNRNVDVLISLNYIDNPSSRFIHVTTLDGTYHCDLVQGVFIENGERSTTLVGRDTTYVEMWKDLINFTEGGPFPSACTFAEGADIVRLIEDIESQGDRPKWITR